MAIPVGVAGALVIGLTFLWESSLSTRTFLTGATVCVVVLGALSGVTFVDGWAKWNYAGYESKAKWPEYEALMAEIDTLLEGRSTGRPPTRNSVFTGRRCPRC